MNDDLFKLLDRHTHMYRKGPAVTSQTVGGIEVVDVYAMEHTEDSDLPKVDMHFVDIGIDVHPQNADRVRDLLNATLADEYPEPERLEGGPSYIEIGANLGSQDYALRLMALGKFLGLWGIIEPERLGFTGDEAHVMAGRGFLMTSGWKRAATENNQSTGEMGEGHD